MENSTKIIITSAVVLCIFAYMYDRKRQKDKKKNAVVGVVPPHAAPFHKPNEPNRFNSGPIYTDEEFYRGGIPGRFQFKRDAEIIMIDNGQNYKAGDVIEGVYFPAPVCPPEAICTMEFKPSIVRWIDYRRGTPRKFEYPDNNLFKKL